MSLIIATGSNLGNRKDNLGQCRELLCRKFKCLAFSRIYHSTAVEFENQPDFLNQVLEFAIPPALTPLEIWHDLQNIETQMGRMREVPKGPRIIDIDFLFWGFATLQTEHLTIPHPRLFSRSFVVLPLMELPFFPQLQTKFSFPEQFAHPAIALDMPI